MPPAPTAAAAPASAGNPPAFYAQRVGVAGRQPLAHGFGETARRVHQTGARFHQRRPDPDRQQVALRLLAAMPDRPQQLRIHPRQPCQQARVQLIVLARAGEISCTCRALATITSCPSSTTGSPTANGCPLPSRSEPGPAPNFCVMAFLGGRDAAFAEATRHLRSTRNTGWFYPPGPCPIVIGCFSLCWLASDSVGRCYSSSWPVSFCTSSAYPLGA